jgi:AbrB family looped-hinge helix DNA binding protein
MTQKGQVTIPVAIRRLLGLSPHDAVAFHVEQGEVRIAPAQSVADRTAGMLKSNRLPLSPQEEKGEVEKAMAEEAEKPRK